MVERTNNNSAKHNLQGERKSWHRFVCLEPVLFLYSIGDYMNYTIQQQYTYYRLAKEYRLPLGYMMETTGGCNGLTQNSTNSTLWDIESKVQADAAIVTLGITLCIQVPAVIISLFFGAWTDKNGRLPALFSPVIGTIVHCVIELIVMYRDLSVYFLFIANFLDGCSGYVPTMKQTSMAYIVDITSENKRIFRVGVLQFLSLMSGVVGYLVSGYWIDEFGFEAPVWFILSCQVLCFLYLFLLSESRPKTPDAPNFFTCNSFKTMWTVFTKHRQSRTRNVLYLLLASSAIFILAVHGVDGVITLYYLASPLCFSSVLIGYMFSFYTLAVATGAVTLTSNLVTRFVSEFKLVVFGALAMIVSKVWLAFSRYRWMIYITPIISFSTGALDPVIKGWMSKIVEPSEEGAMFAVVTTVDTIAIVLGTSMFNLVYAELVELDFGGGTFLLSGTLAFIPLGMLCSIRKKKFSLEQRRNPSLNDEKNGEIQNNENNVSQCEEHPEKDKITTKL